MRLINLFVVSAIILASPAYGDKVIKQTENHVDKTVCPDNDPLGIREGNENCLPKTNVINGSNSQTAPVSEKNTYISCLKNSFKGGHHFTASEVRSLCEEISGTQDPTYKWSAKEMIPSNEFTKCYDRERETLKVLGDKKSDEVAKIVCRYEAK